MRDHNCCSGCAWLMALGAICCVMAMCLMAL